MQALAHEPAVRARARPQAGSGVLTLGLSDSPGVPATTAAATLTAKYNDLDSVRALFEANKARAGLGSAPS